MRIDDITERTCALPQSGGNVSYQHEYVVVERTKSANGADASQPWCENSCENSRAPPSSSHMDAQSASVNGAASSADADIVVCGCVCVCACVGVGDAMPMVVYTISAPSRFSARTSSVPPV